VEETFMIKAIFLKRYRQLSVIIYPAAVKCRRS